jgi:hypothetical protein
MANHIKLDSTDVTPLTRDLGHGHDVTDQARHLKSHTGAKGSSVPDSLDHLASKEFDSESHFTSKAAQANKGAEKVTKEQK